MLTEIPQPYDHAAEQAVLGSLLITPDMYYDVAGILTADMFFRPQHRAIYEAIDGLLSKSQPADIITIPAAMGDTTGDTVNYLMELVNVPESSYSALAYAGIVADKAARRRLIDAAGAIAKSAFDPAFDTSAVYAEAEVILLDAYSGGAINPVHAPQGYVSTFIDEFMQRAEGKPVSTGVKTGLIDLDQLLIELETPHQYIIAGRPGMGKSSLALGIILDAILQQRKRVLLFSLEMSERQIMRRLVSMMTSIPVSALRREWELTPHQQSQVLHAGGELSEARLYIDASPGLKPADIRQRATRAYIEHGLDLVVVDHMHLMQPDKQTANRVLDLGSISQSLADTYKTLDVAGLTLAQLSRGVESRASKIPMMSDLRESGQIEENAYGIMFLYREGYYDDSAPQGPAKLILAKHRDGETGQVDLYWRGELSMYANAQQVQL
jgi:replicative DNA helicase